MENKEYMQALAVVAEAQQASVTMLQRQMRIGYSKASKFIQQMEEDGHIGPYNGSTPRVVHIKPDNVPKATKGKQPTKTKATSAKKPAANTKTAQSKRKPQEGTQDATEGEEKPKVSRKGIGGRPKLWYELDIPGKLEAIKGWCMQGATMKELAEMIGCHESTLYEWRNEYPEFRETLRAGRNVANGELLAAAFKASSGFHEQTKVAIKYKTYEEFHNPKTGEKELKPVEKVAVVDTVDYVPPNAQLLQFMLTNRLPDQYKKKDHIEHSGGISDLGYMSDEDLEAELRHLEGGGSVESMSSD